VNFIHGSWGGKCGQARRDNGYGAGIDFKPAYYLDFECDYRRSAPLHLNSYSFGIGINRSSLVRPRAH